MAALYGSEISEFGSYKLNERKLGNDYKRKGERNIRNHDYWRVFTPSCPDSRVGNGGNG
jgi:hypothetical protein